MPLSPELSPSRYLLWSVAASIGCLAVIAAGLVYADAQGRLAPLPFSGNLCLDEKVKLVRSVARNGCGLLIAGSSMALNNFASEPVLQQHPEGARLLNIGAWGMKIKETREWISYVLKVTKPSEVILVVGPMDFYGASHINLKNEVIGFLEGHSYPTYMLRNFDLLYYATSYFSIPRARRKRDHYQSLAFDRWGGLPLDVQYPNVDPVRWNAKIRPDQFDDVQYRELERLAADLQRAGIVLYCVQAPLRSGSIPPEDEAAAQQHWSKVAAAVSRHGQHFINMHEHLHLDDTAYADYSHLNAKGARLFTEAFLQTANFERSATATRKTTTGKQNQVPVALVHQQQH
jgi:hypothetical protein